MRVFSVPVSAPFLRTVIAALVDGRLVEGFEARAHPERLAQATLYLPTRRAGRLAREIFLDELGKPMRRCCRASSRSATSTKTNWPSRRMPSRAALRPLDIPPELGELERRLMLARLVAAWAQTAECWRRWWSAVRPRRWRWPAIWRG